MKRCYPPFPTGLSTRRALSLILLIAKLNAPGGGMAFQAMNHGLEARAASLLRIKATYSVPPERVLLHPYASVALLLKGLANP